ncbi:MAG TPA: DNA helicase II, partial [Rhodospirillales bacterium]|nr:DNA helicase II [Rhodospirillales bacterium]
KSNFAILDEDDQLRLIKRILRERGMDDKRCPPRGLLAVIQRWKDRGLEPGQVTAAEDTDFADGKARSLYGDYQDSLRRVNAVDFGDLLLLCLKLFREQPDILKRYQDKFKYILVDEYQDTNVAQYLWLRLLAQTRKNICCVGDDDQSIYSWRGAEVGNILRFENDFPGARVVRLERNYRSTPHILAAASGLIAHNSGRLGKTLWTELSSGEKVRVRGVWDGESEARTVGGEIESLHSKGEFLNGMAVLVRTGAQTREFEERLITLGVPYRVVGGLRFYERREIRDAVAYLRVIAQGADDLAFERIVNFPKRGLGPAALNAVHGLARSLGLPLIEAARKLVETDEMTPKPRGALAALVGDIKRWQSLSDGLGPSDLMEQVLNESGVIAHWEADKSPEAPGRLENLKELVAALEDFGGLTEFLEHVSLVMEMDKAAGDDKVTLMTLHGAKGLEYDTVFLAGWEEGLFPHQRVMGEMEGGGLEEERRLAYVGLTRAKRRAIILHAANRRIHGRWLSALPSRFISELPAEHMDISAESGLFGSKSSAPSHRRFKAAAYAPSERSPAPGERNGDPDGAFHAGQRIFHQKFGYGRVVTVEDDKLQIAFEKAGGKKVMGSFVKPA